MIMRSSANFSMLAKLRLLLLVHRQTTGLLDLVGTYCSFEVVERKSRGLRRGRYVSIVSKEFHWIFEEK